MVDEDSTDANTYWIVGDEFTGLVTELVVYKSSDAGETWPDRFQLTNAASYGYGYSIHCVDHNSDVVLAGGYTDGLPCVFRTLDGGATWDDITGDMVNFGFNTVPMLWADPDNVDHIVAGTAYNLFYTTDGGVTWNDVTMPNYYWAYGLEYNTGTGVLWMGSYDAGVFYSKDKGVTWTEMNTGLGSISITDMDIDYKHGWIYAATSGGGLNRLDVAKSFHLALDPDPLQAGSTVDVTVSNGLPNQAAWLGYSFDGWGNTPVSALGVVIDMAGPKYYAGPQSLNSAGKGTMTFTVPPYVAGRSIWIQVAQSGQVTNPVVTWGE